MPYCLTNPQPSTLLQKPPHSLVIHHASSSRFLRLVDPTGRRDDPRLLPVLWWRKSDDIQDRSQIGVCMRSSWHVRIVAGGDRRDPRNPPWCLGTTRDLNNRRSQKPLVGWKRSLPGCRKGSINRGVVACWDFYYLIPRPVARPASSILPPSRGGGYRKCAFERTLLIRDCCYTSLRQWQTVAFKAKCERWNSRQNSDD